MKKILLTLLCALLPLLGWAQENEPYAVLSEDNTVLTFYYDNQKTARNGMSVGPFSEPDYSSWHAECESITTVVFDASFAGCTTLTSTACWFHKCSNLAAISGMENLKTDNVQYMDVMFFGCSSLTSLDVSGFKTDNVQYMYGMFEGCSGLMSLDVSGFKTDNVTSMGHMFSGCSGLTSLDVSGFKTDNVQYMYGMFEGCSGLTSLDVSGFKTDNVQYMYGMFSGCSGLTSLDVSGFNTSNVTTMEDMFSGCSGLTSLDVSGFKTDNVMSMDRMFSGCSGLTSLDVSGFNTGNVTSMDYMFYGCSSLTSLGVSGFNTGNVTSMDYMFYDCSSLTSLDVSGFNTGNVTSMDYMFFGCSGLTSLDVSGFKTDNVMSMDRMFWGCSGLTSLDVSGFNTGNVTSMYGMFYGCSSLTSLGVSGFKTDNVTNISGIFDGCSGLTSLDVSGFNTSNVTTMEDMFSGCSGLTRLDLSGFKTDNVTSMWGMFFGCSGLTTIYVGEGWNTSSVTEGGWMFLNCSNLVGGKGTKYQDDHVDHTYARIDQGPSSDAPGYFTRSGDAPWVEPEPTEAYAVLSDNNTVLTFYYDNQKAERNGMSIGPFLGPSEREWNDNCKDITSVVFDLSFASDSTLTSTAYWFWGCSNLTTISGIENLNTENVTDMKYMFVNCSSLTSLDLSTLNTKNVTNISQLFPGCSSLTSLDLSGFNTSNVTDMSYMFYGCSSLVTIYVGEGWNTSAVTEGGWMFSSCSNLVGGKGTKYDGEHADYTYARIDQGPDSEAPGYFTRSGDAPWVEPEPAEAYAVLSDNNTVLTFYYDNQKTERNGMGVGPFYFDEQSQSANQSWATERETITTVVFDASFAACTTLTSTSCWFWGCSNLTTISGMENLNTFNVTDMNMMFYGCSGLTSLDLSNFKTSNVTDMGAMFLGCSGLTSLDLSNFNTSSVVYMNGIFWGCSGFTSLDVSGFKTDNVKSMTQMFWGCSNLTNLDLSNFNTANVTDMYGMFCGCGGLTSLDLSRFKTGNVWNMADMFGNCSGLTNLDLSGFNTSNVTGMMRMFDGCGGLTNLDLSGFNTSNVTDMSGMFSGCFSLVNLDLSSFNTENVTEMGAMSWKEGMFSGCSNLTTIYVGEGWTTANVTEGAEMFKNCSNLVGGMGTKYDADRTDYIYARIDQGPDSDAPGYFTRSGDIPWGEKSTFDGRVLTVRGSGSIDAALAQVGGFEQVDKTITAIVWEADVPYSGEAAFSNPNLLFYANDATKGQAINNLIYNGVAESITLTDEGEGNIDFYCPQSFTARSITYRRSFQQQTEIGVSRGWETIALPFTVQRISRVRSDEGLDRITPFGSSESTRHFWLRRLTANGLQSVQAIEANTPYIIAMPNSEEYAAEYNLAGDIVFTAENAPVAVTEPVSDRSTDYELTANFERMAAQDSIYVLNVGTPRYGYPEGSIFEAAYRDLQPFRAYTRHINSGRPAPPYFALGSLGGNTTTGISSVSDTFATDTWYDIQGRKLQGRPTKKGVYIHNGRKVIVK